MNVYLNDEDIRYLQREQTPVKPGDTLSIVPSVAGGAPTPTRRRAGGLQPATAELSPDEIKRYSRHLIMPEVGMDGQRKLKAGSVLCIGAGGLGSPAAMYLAAAGIGRIGIVDFDVVDFSNLQRQLLHTTNDVGRSKLESAKDKIDALNPHVQVDTYEDGALVARTRCDLFKGYDVILDGTDNFPTRYLVNDACVLIGQAERVRQHLPVRGPGVGVRDEGRPVLSLPLSRAAAARTRAELRRGRRAGRAARHHRRDPGDRDDQADPRHRRAADRPLPDLRRAEDEVPRAEAAEGSGLPGVRHASDRHQADRLRAVLRHPAGAAAAADAGATVSDWEITPVELKKKLDAGETPFILDVREPNEYQINRIPGSTLIPLGELPRRYQELPRDREIVAQCKMGGRSAKAHGFPEVGRVHQRQEPEGRNSGVDRQGRSVPAQVLRRSERMSDRS